MNCAACTPCLHIICFACAPYLSREGLGLHRANRYAALWAPLDQNRRSTSSGFTFCKLSLLWHLYSFYQIDEWLNTSHKMLCLCCLTASPRIMFLKRLLVCYALCGVYYSEAKRGNWELWVLRNPWQPTSMLLNSCQAGNAEQLGDPWPYPIAGDPKITGW